MRRQVLAQSHWSRPHDGTAAMFHEEPGPDDEPMTPRARAIADYVQAALDRAAPSKAGRLIRWQATERG